MPSLARRAQSRNGPSRATERARAAAAPASILALARAKSARLAPSATPISIVETIRVEVGYWRLSNRTTDIRRCQYYDDPDKTPCKGQEEIGDALCVAEGNQHGPLCKLCDEPIDGSRGGYYNEDSGRCNECPEAGGRIGSLIGVVIAILSAVSLIAWIYYRPPNGLERTSARVRRLIGVIEPLGLWPKLKQLIAFFQVLFSLGAVYRTNLPREFYHALQWLNWITFDLFDIYPVACVGDISLRLLIAALGPLILIAILIPLATAIGKAFESTRKGAALGCSASLIIIWAITPTVAKMLFQVFDCEGFTEDSEGGRDNFFMYGALRIRCSANGYSSPEYDGLVALSGVFLAIRPIGMPLLLAFLLVRAQRPATKRVAAKADEINVLARATAPLAREFDPTSYYWEVVEIVRRLIITAVLLAIPSTQGMTRLAIALVTCFLYLILLFTVRPFKRLDDMIIAASSNVLLVFTFLTSIFVKVFDDIEIDQGGSTTLAQRVMGFSSSFEISSLSSESASLRSSSSFCDIIEAQEDPRRAAARSGQPQQGARPPRDPVKQQLRHPAVFITFDVFRALGKMTSYEDARERGCLHVIDTFEQLIEFTRTEATLFVSHQWLARYFPDTHDHVQFRALCEACDELCNLKGISHAEALSMDRLL